MKIFTKEFPDREIIFGNERRFSRVEIPVLQEDEEYSIDFILEDENEYSDEPDNLEDETHTEFPEDQIDTRF